MLLGHFFYLCSKIYNEFEGDDLSVRYEARTIIAESNLDDFKEFIAIWEARQEKFFPKISLKERAGLRRGFDILTVESLSQY